MGVIQHNLLVVDVVAFLQVPESVISIIHICQNSLKTMITPYSGGAVCVLM